MTYQYLRSSESRANSIIDLNRRLITPLVFIIINLMPVKSRSMSLPFKHNKLFRTALTFNIA